MTNREFSETDKAFQAACEQVGSKWRRKKGLAWKEGRK